MQRIDAASLKAWRHQWQDEAGASFLYGKLAGCEPDAKHRELYLALAAVEREHVEVWRKLFEDHGVDLPPPVPSRRARLLAWLGKRFGPGVDRARPSATGIMSSPEEALVEKVREELGIGVPHTTPLREGWITGLATAVGALIPVVPFLLTQGAPAMWASFAVGLGVAGVGYLVGDLLVRWLR